MGGLETLAVTPDSFAIWSNEKFFKVPGHVATFNRFPDDEFGVTHQAFGVVVRNWKLFLQPLKYWMFTLTIDRNLFFF
jgi:hypothetical protein